MESQQPAEEFGPIFYVGQHESDRSLPITENAYNQARDYGYDFITTPITTSHFHSRVLTLLSQHLADPQEYEILPVIPPLDPVDTPLTPGENISQLVAHASTWIDLSSPDPLISNLSQQVLALEIAYAAFCGVGHVVIPGPKIHDGPFHGDGICQYARAIQESLKLGNYMSIQILLPMINDAEKGEKEDIGSLRQFARGSHTDLAKLNIKASRTLDLMGSWDAWNVTRTLCKYSSRLFVALSMPRHLPPEEVQSRWFSEPLRLLSYNSETFQRNNKGYPVLHRSHQNLISRYMRLRNQPWIVLSDVGKLIDHEQMGQTHMSTNPFGSNSGENSQNAFPPLQSSTVQNSGKRSRDPTPHLSYIRHLQRNQPPRSTIERFGSGYQDFLQAPLQPLTDNLESITYEVFEKDPIKYDWYERAISAALTDWSALKKPTSGTEGRVVVAVVGAGRGPLVSRALRAADTSGVSIDMWAVEKNPNAYVLLQRHNEAEWANRVTIVKSDMRSWLGPVHTSAAKQIASISSSSADSWHSATTPSRGKVDILISELLGSFADNELSPECLDGVSELLAPNGISIPTSYTAHITPLSAPKLHTDIISRTLSDPEAPVTPYVVMLHAVDFLSTLSNPNEGGIPVPDVQECWKFSHPLPANVLHQSNLRKAGGPTGGGGGLAGGDGANEHNSRYCRLKFRCKNRGVCNGLAGYFETVLYENPGGRDLKVELSTNPVTMDVKSRDMISWFPMFFPLKNPLYVPDNTELAVSIWRQTDDRKVWYEWMVEAFMILGNGDQKVRVACSDLHSSQKNGCLM